MEPHTISDFLLHAIVFNNISAYFNCSTSTLLSDNGGTDIQYSRSNFYYTESVSFINNEVHSIYRHLRPSIILLDMDVRLCLIPHECLKLAAAAVGCI